MDRYLVIGIFILFFFLGSTVGFVRTYNWINSDDAVEEYLLEHISEVWIEDAYFLVSYRENQRVFVYSVDKNEIIKLDKEAILNPRKNNPELQSFINDIGAAAGGITLGYTAIDLIKNASRISALSGSIKGRNKILAAIAGSISGYYVGRWLAETMFLPAMDSEIVLKRLKNDEFWLKAERERMSLIGTLIRRFIEADRKMDNPKLTKFHLEWIKLIYDFPFNETGEIDLRSSNFEEAFALREEMINTIFPTEEEKEWYKNPFWIIFGLIILVFGITFFMYWYVSFRKVKRLRKLYQRLKEHSVIELIELLFENSYGEPDKIPSYKELVKGLRLNETAEENQLVKSFRTYGVVSTFQMQNLVLNGLRKKTENPEIKFSDYMIQKLK